MTMPVSALHEGKQTCSGQKKVAVSTRPYRAYEWYRVYHLSYLGHSVPAWLAPPGNRIVHNVIRNQKESLQLQRMRDTRQR